MLRREKRQHRRVMVSVEAELKACSADGRSDHPAPHKALVTNLSSMGMSVRLPEVHPVGTVFRVRLQMGDVPCSFFAVVRRVYSTTVIHPSHFGHGLQIIAAPEEAVELVDTYLDRVSGRAPMAEPRTVEAFPQAEAATVLAPPTIDQSSLAPRATL